MKIEDLTQKVLEGQDISRDEARFLYNYPDLDKLCDEADRICRRTQPETIDSCSIINARSGRCSEDCKWCAQSAHYHTECDQYDKICLEEALEAARKNKEAGIRRFSLVTSGRSLTDSQLEYFCHIIERIIKETGLYVCASFGLLSEQQMQRLARAGVKRYHCNMETSNKHFATLCSTHSPSDKHSTLKAATEAGMQICSGGIIGMGESREDRIDFAFELRELNPDSVPINILTPIPGTPLENIPLISEEEIIRTVALFRFVLPQQALRFAGGRMRVCAKSQHRIMCGGMNGVLMGDMLTTISNQIADDKKMFAETGWKY